MENSSEYYVQIFLFVATILCYIILAVFLFYGIYYCCLRACILRTKRERQEDEAEETEPENQSYCRRVQLLYPFHRDQKNAMIVPSTNTDTSNVYLKDNSITDSSISVTLVDERNSFIDKKYYDIFVA